MIPVGSIVMFKDYPPNWDGPSTMVIRRGKVVGYDMTHTKYHVAPEFMPGKFTKEGCCWPFKNWVVEDYFQHG